MSLDAAVLDGLLNALPDGVLVCDVSKENWPIVWVNEILISHSEKARSNILGQSLESLSGSDLSFGNQLVHAVSAAIQAKTSNQFPLEAGSKKSVHKSSGFAQLYVAPIIDSEDRVSHVACFYRALPSFSQADMTRKSDGSVNKSLSPVNFTARLTGLLNKDYFLQQLRCDFSLAQREMRSLTVFSFVINHAAAYKEVFGDVAAELTFKRVAGVVAGCFRRSSDWCTRWDDSRILVATLTTDPEQARHYAALIQAKVRDLAIHHPRASGARFLTLNVAVVSRVPESTETLDAFI